MIENGKQLITELAEMSDQHGEMKSLIETLFHATCSAYGVDRKPEDCKKALEEQFERMKKIVLPDFDDSE
jgi:hypothetical protein